jgi:uncharacterized membrane protein YhhN
LKYIFFALYLIVVVTHLYSCIRTGRHTLRKITKCLLMPLLALCYRSFAVDFSILVFLALIFGFIGDAFLLAPGWNWSFGAGLGAFAVGHILYTAHVLDALPELPKWYLFVLLALICCMLSLIALRYLWDGLPPVLRAPCIFYMLDISFMACCTVLFALSGLSALAPLAAFGGVLFIVSDSALSIDAFKKPLPQRYIIVMGTYIAAQTLLAAAFALS